jgi:pyruvyltransferase
MGVPPQKVAALRALSPHVHVINIRGGVFPVLQEILASESVLSSSLHGIVAAEAYGIPVRFVQLHEWPDDGNDEYFKYNDYFASTERPPMPPLDWRGAVTIDMVEREAELLRRATRSALRIDLMPIVRACPFNRLDIARPEDLRLEYIDLPA